MNYSMDYLAGIFDGEGSVSINVSARKGRPNSHFVPCLTVGNTFEPVVAWFKVNYGGYIRTEKKSNGVVIYQWQLRGGNQIRKFIDDFINRVHIKQRELLVLKAFLDYSQSIRASWPGNLRYDTEILTNFLTYRDEIRALHSSVERCNAPTS